MAKKQKCPEFENHERWLVAYADMMTLLFALFVVLYALQMQDIERLKSAAKSIQKAFGRDMEEDPDATGHPSGNSRVEDAIFKKVQGNTTRESLATRNRRERAAIIAAEAANLEKALREAYKEGSSEQKAIAGDSDERVVYFKHDLDGIQISLLARGFFLPSQVELDSSAYRVLDGVAAAVKAVGRVVRVEGHTDASPTWISLPIMQAKATNWELSVLRAATVVRYFIDKHKFPKDIIYAAGYGDTRPVAPNDTAKNRSMNRRVDLKVLYDAPKEYEKSERLPEGADVVSPPDEEAPKKDETEKPKEEKPKGEKAGGSH